MSLFVNDDELEYPSRVTAGDKTPDDILEMVQARITDWAHASDYGTRLRRSDYRAVVRDKRLKRPANLLVTRKHGGKLKQFLAIKIANRTLTYMPWDAERDVEDQKTQIQNCLEALAEQKDSLFELYKKVCEQLPNTGNVWEDSE